MRLTHVCILSFSEISRDSRVLRQIEYACREFEVDVIGFGKWHPQWNNVHFHEVKPKKPGLFQRLQRSGYMLAGRIFPPLWSKAYWYVPYHRKALVLISKHKYDILHANDLNTLPIALEVAQQTGSKVLFDAHEYYLDQAKKFWLVRSIHYGYQKHLLHYFCPKADKFVTVSDGIARLYREVLGIKPSVIMNTPKPTRLQFRAVDLQCIRLIHHGGASRGRHLESLIKMMPHLGERFTLHFMLVDPGGSYLQDLISLAYSLAPGRVFFRDPVPSTEVVRTIAEFDIGVYILPPNVLNHKFALPNKFFDFIAAGLVVAIGPSTEMARLLRKYKFGVVAEGFAPRDLALALSALSAQEINSMKRNALAAAKELNADIEMSKLLSIYHDLLA